MDELPRFCNCTQTLFVLLERNVFVHQILIKALNNMFTVELTMGKQVDKLDPNY